MKSQETIDTVWKGFLAISCTLAMMMLPMEALAVTTGQGSALANVMCNLVTWATGPIGQGLATFALIIVGVGALMGKVSWGMAIIVALGVAIVFGAAGIVAALGANNATACTSNAGVFGTGAGGG